MLFFVTNSESKLRVEFKISIDDKAKDNLEFRNMLMDELVNSYKIIRSKYIQTGTYMRVCCETDEINNMQFFLEKGFRLSAVLPVLKYDLTKEIVENTTSDDITIEKYDFSSQGVKAYIEADNSTDNNDALSEAEVKFMIGDPSFTCFVAMCEGKIVGSISIWNITVERAATENIFVVPEFRGKNIARALICTAFEELQKRNIKTATLSMRGTNSLAMCLYLSSGYSLYYNLLEMVYEYVV